MPWSFIKFSQLIHEGNVWRSVWRICMWILGLKGSNSNHLCDRYLITDVCVVCGWWGKFVILCLSCFVQVNVKMLLWHKLPHPCHIKFSQLIHEGNVWRSLWRICMWILGLKGSNSHHLCDRYLITDVYVVCGWWGKFVILCLSCFM